MNSASMNPTQHQIPQKDRLSCKLCQRRKVGCDKGDPCSTCKRAGVKCEISARQRLPRGRNGGRKKNDAELKQRIGRLEALVTTLSSTNANDAGSPSSLKIEEQSAVQQQPTPEAGSMSPEESAPDMTRYLGSSYWSYISEEVNGLRDILDASSESEEDTPEPDQYPEHAKTSKPSNFNFVLCGPNSFMMAPDALQYPSPANAAKLLKWYFDGVDTIFNMVHTPSIMAHVQDGKPYLGHAPGDPAVTALIFAIFYSAVATVTDDVCKFEMGESKAALRNRYRFAVEVSLAQADFINSRETSCLQALLLLLVATRTDDNSRWTWTLLALVVRIAHALGLQREPPPSLNVFEAEMRRRLWYCICMLDGHCSNDRGSDTIIRAPEYDTKLPLNIFDEDISPESTVLPPERVGFTPMTPCLMIQSCMELFWRLCYVQLSDYERPPLPMQYDWGKRQAWVESQLQFLQDKFLRHCDENASLLQMFVKRCGESMGPLLRLVALRPIQRHPAARPPRVDNKVILKLAVDLLNITGKIYQDPAVVQFGWYIWVQWHPLAVALAELCSQTEGPLVEEAWHVVDTAFNQFADLVADSRRGMLWRPIEKLYKKAKANKAARDAQKKPQLSVGEQSFDFSSQPSSGGGFQLPSQQSSMDDTTTGFDKLDVGNDVFNWAPTTEEPIDMAWLDWATFTKDFTMSDSVNLMDPA